MGTCVLENVLLAVKNSVVLYHLMQQMPEQCLVAVSIVLATLLVYLQELYH